MLKRPTIIRQGGKWLLLVTIKLLIYETTKLDNDCNRPERKKGAHIYNSLHGNETNQQVQ